MTAATSTIVHYHRVFIERDRTHSNLHSRPFLGHVTHGRHFSSFRFEHATKAFFACSSGGYTQHVWFGFGGPSSYALFFYGIASERGSALLSVSGGFAVAEVNDHRECVHYLLSNGNLGLWRA